MIKIDFIEPETSEWLKWCDDCRTAQASFNTAIEFGENVSADSKLYGRLKKSIYTDRQGAFRGKCIFCEQRIRTHQHGDMEHFRPKGAVRDEQNQPILRRGIDKPHPGYYWLAYDWRNLLPSCVLCNQPSTDDSGQPIGKRNYFPLADEGQRAQAPGEEVHEQPLLIHPLFEDPAEHLGLDPSGVFFAKNNSPRGEACIRIFGLNLRDLPDERARVYSDTKKLYKSYLVNRLNVPSSPEVAEDRRRIESIEAGSDEFTAAARLAIADAKREIRALIDGL